MLVRESKQTKPIFSQIFFCFLSSKNELRPRTDCVLPGRPLVPGRVRHGGRQEGCRCGTCCTFSFSFLFFSLSCPPFSIPLALDFLLFSSNYTHNLFHSFAVQIAVRGESVIVIGVEKRTIPTLQDPRTIRKIIQLDENICFTFSGIIFLFFSSFLFFYHFIS